MISNSLPPPININLGKTLSQHIVILIALTNYQSGPFAKVK